MIYINEGAKMTTQSEVTKTKRTRVPMEIKTTSSTNLPTYAALVEEFEMGIMPERKKVALLAKLVGLYDSQKLDEQEESLLRMILVQDRNRGSISPANTFILNNMEQAECSKECYVRVDNAPDSLNLSQGKVCKFRYDSSIGRNAKGVITGRFVVYVPVTIAGEAQLTYAQAIRKGRGIELDPSEIPEDKVLYRRVCLTKKEFDKWFGFDDDSLISKPAEKPEYEF